MCGIFGATTITPDVARLLPFLACRMEERGHDSWGSTDGDYIYRALGDITSRWGEEAPQRAIWESEQSGAIFHTRAASSGNVTIENAHPFVAESGTTRIIGIHNGCLHDHESLNKTYGRKFSVDSQHIFQHLAEKRKFTDIYGWAALAWYEIDLAANSISPINLGWFASQNLALAQLSDGVYVFASTLNSLIQAVNMCQLSGVKYLTLKEDTQYQIWTGLESPLVIGSLGYQSTSVIPRGFNTYPQFTYTPPAIKPTTSTECFYCGDPVDGAGLFCLECLNVFHKEFQFNPTDVLVPSDKAGVL